MEFADTPLRSVTTTMRCEKRTSRIRRALCLFLASASITLGAAALDSRTEAHRLYAAGQYQAALPYFDQVVRSKPNDLDSWNKRGCIHLRLNQPALALADFNEAVRVGTALPQSPEYPAALNNRGIALLMLGRDDESAADFQRALAIRTRDRGIPFGSQARAWRSGMALAHNGLGQVWHKKKDDDKALFEFEQAIALDPANPDGFIGRGIALTSLGRYDEAVGTLHVALRLAPTDARAHGYLGSTLDRMGRNDDALDEYDASIRLDPDVAAIRRLRGSLLSRLGRHEAAFTDFSETIRIDPKSSEAYKDRGGVLNRMGKSESARIDLNEAIRLDPRNVAALQNRAASDNGLGRYREAILDCDQALAINPRCVGAYNNRGLAWIGLGQYVDAIDNLNQAIALDPKQPAAYLNRGGVYARLGQNDRAMADFDRVAQLDPKLALAYQGVGPAHDLLRLRARSAAQFDLATSTPAPSAIDNLQQGNILRDQGDLPAALAAFDRAIEADPSLADAYACRGWTRLCLSEPGAESDARAWLGLKSWSDPFAPYMALLGSLSARDSRRDLASIAFADDALNHLQPAGVWPSPLFRYLKGDLSEVDLLLASRTPRETTEARTILGRDRLRRDEPKLALDHLHWVRDHGQGPSIARDLALATLRQVEPPAPRNPPNPADPSGRLP